MNRFLERIRSYLKPIRETQDIEEELRTHLEMAAEDNQSRGLSHGEARRLASLELRASTLSITERVREGDFVTKAEALWQDFAAGWRAVRDTPVFTVTAVLTLAVGIGANTAIFSLLYALLLRGLPVQSPGELASISIALQEPGDEYRRFMPYRMTEAYRAQQHSFSSIGLWDLGTVSMKDAAGTLRLFDTGLVSGDTFAVLGLKPHFGRLILPFDERSPAAGSWPVVLSFRFWKERFSGDPNIVGRPLNISGAPATIVGVAPPGFEGISPGVEPRLYVPFHFISVMAGQDLLQPSIFYWCAAIGRLQPGVSAQQARTEARRLQPGLFKTIVPPQLQSLPEFRRAGLVVRTARSGLPSEYSALYAEPLYVLQALVLVVLVLCCINVGGLMMARVYARQREFAVRSAIGGGRTRLTRQYLAESFIIALAGATLGGLTAWFGSPALLHFFRDPKMFEPPTVHLDIMVFWITAFSAIATTLAFGTLPALRASRVDCGILLRSRNVGGNRTRRSVRAFIPLQVGLSLALVAIATLLSQSLRLIRAEHRGFDVDHVTIQTPPFHRLPQQGNARLDVYQQVVDRLEHAPGVRSAAITWFTPMSGQQAMGNFAVANTSARRRRYIAYNLVGPGYFRTMETKILLGREFGRQERDLSVCVLNRAAADLFFPREAPLGKYIQHEVSEALESRNSCRVVGLVENAKFASLRDPAPPTIYYSISVQNGRVLTNFVFLINAGTKRQAIDAYRKAIAEVAPSIPLVLFATLREQMDAELGTERLTMLLSDLFAVVGLLLSAIGLYGLLSTSVAQRTPEIGVRVALGARRVRVIALILSEAVGLLAIGTGLGALVLFYSVRFIDKMLFGVSRFDPVILTASLALLAVVTLGAASFPAIRAASLDPMRALRID